MEEALGSNPSTAKQKTQKPRTESSEMNLVKINKFFKNGGGRVKGRERLGDTALLL
jgi:hypothetical protein